jgi:hypothetical protein
MIKKDIRLIFWSTIHNAVFLFKNIALKDLVDSRFFSVDGRSE